MKQGNATPKKPMIKLFFWGSKRLCNVCRAYHELR